MLTGFVLFYVGAVLVINGLWLLDRIDGREIVVINLVTALVSGAVVLHDAFGHQADAASIRNATLSLLFCTTYLWVAWNRISGADGRGLGWFSLFVAVTALPVSVLAFRDALGAGNMDGGELAGLGRAVVSVFPDAGAADAGSAQGGLGDAAGGRVYRLAARVFDNSGGVVRGYRIRQALRKDCQAG